MDVDARLEALEAENERLRDELETLKDSLGMNFLAPPELRLTGHETRLFGRLLKGDVASKAALLTAIYNGRDEAEIKIIDVFICNMRKKLKPFGLEIATIWGVGYRMTPESKTAFAATWPAALAA